MIYKEAKYKCLKYPGDIKPNDILLRKKDNLFYSVEKYSTVDIDSLMYAFFFGFIVRKMLLHLHFQADSDGMLFVYQEGKF